MPSHWIIPSLVIFPIEHEIKYTKEATRSASNLNIDKLRTTHYESSTGYMISIFLFIYSYISAPSAYGVHIYLYQLVWCSRICISSQDFLDRRLLPTRQSIETWIPSGEVEGIHSQMCMVAIVTWLNVTECLDLCLWICFFYRMSNMSTPCS
jgi:hypothetical protein